jgi:rubrerythrin
MNNHKSALARTGSRRSKTLSRRGIIVAGAFTGLATAFSACAARDKTVSNAQSSPSTTSGDDDSTDIAILNAAIDLEHQAIWAYGAAGSKLTKTPVGKTILALALRNRADHIKHRDALVATVKSLGGTPSPAKESYDLSTYIDAGEGNLDSDANIGKLALALEYDAALAYIDAFSKLKNPKIIAAAGTIAPDESAHVTAIRAVFKTLIPSIEYVPSAFVSAETRNDWILKV